MRRLSHVFRIWGGLFLGLGLLAAPDVSARELKAAVIAESPLAMVEPSSGTVSGLVGGAVDTILRQTGHLPRYEAFPPARAYHLVEIGAVDLLLTALRTSDRAALAHYSAPVVTEYNVLVVAKGQGFPFGRLSDLVGRSIGGRTGFRYPTLDAAEGVIIERNISSEANIQKMLAGRLDAVVVGSISGIEDLRRSGQFDKVEFLPMAVDAVPLGVAFARGAFSEEDVLNFNTRLASLKQSPQWGLIMGRAGAGDLVRSWPLAP